MPDLPVAAERHHRRFGGGGEQHRLEFGRDCDHILYSSAFRRLAGVTQVVGPNEVTLFHNRLTHSLKVGQVGKMLTHKLRAKTDGVPSLEAAVAEYGGGLDRRVVNAACLAHDLGHPPFGHIAEAALQKVLSDRPDEDARGELYPAVGNYAPLADGFEGNAQTFRIVTKLAFREARDDGRNSALNLTAATLSAILKYPWANTRRPEGVPAGKPKWGYYDSEEHFFDFASRGARVGREVELYNGSAVMEYRTVEAQIMDWADDISYAVHDVEDFFRAGLIPLDVLARSDGHFQDFFDYAWPRVAPLFVNEAGEAAAKREIAGLIDGTRELLPTRPYIGSRDDRESLHRFASTIIDRATDNVALTERGLVLPEKRELALIETFKQLTWYYVLDQPAHVSAQRGQVFLIRQLYRDLRIWARSVYRTKDERAFAHRPKLPPLLLEYLEIAFSTDPIVGCVNYDEDDQKINRAVVDYICSLTEAQAVQLSARLRGVAPTSVLESWIDL